MINLFKSKCIAALKENNCWIWREYFLYFLSLYFSKTRANRLQLIIETNDYVWLDVFWEEYKLYYQLHRLTEVVLKIMHFAILHENKHKKFFITLTFILYFDKFMKYESHNVWVQILIILKWICIYWIIYTAYFWKPLHTHKSTSFNILHAYVYMTNRL